MDERIEIFAGEVTDMDAHVYARFCGSQPVVLRGTIRGPFCDNVRTLVAKFDFHDLRPEQAGVAEAVVTDPCMWSHEMPHLYRVDVQALQGEHIAAEYHGTIGLERLAPRRPVDFAPGTG
jgi:hypothetical protein